MSTGYHLGIGRSIRDYLATHGIWLRFYLIKRPDNALGPVPGDPGIVIDIGNKSPFRFVPATVPGMAQTLLRFIDDPIFAWLSIYSSVTLRVLSVELLSTTMISRSPGGML
jgi:hypothetical protein